MSVYCPECGCELVLEDDGDYYCNACEVYFDPIIAKYYSEPLSPDYCADAKDCPEEGCRACGNPAYPKCVDSCPLLDD